MSRDINTLNELTEMQDYIIHLKRALKKQYKENLCYKNVELELSRYRTIVLPFGESMITTLNHNANYIAITTTFDPNRFDNLLYTSVEHQITYLRMVVSDHIRHEIYTNIYATFEQHQNGVIHMHAIIRIYNISIDNISQIRKAFNSKMTTNINSKVNTLIKPVNDIEGWLVYMNKETEYPPISYNMERFEKCLELFSGI